MKRLSFLAAAVLVGYICHYDIKYGTIPSATADEPSREVINMQPAPPSENSDKLSYTIVKVRAGDTVLSIMETLLQGPLPVSISKMISDFKLLNDGKEPESIQVGKDYKFPLYKKD